MNETIYLKKLEQREIKPTAIRLLILKTMMQHKEAFSLLDLENELDTVDKSTIYRTITLFLAHHLVHGIDDGTGSLKYAVCSNDCNCEVDDLHTHFYCENCHRTFCMKSIHVPIVTLPPGFTDFSKQDSIFHHYVSHCRNRNRQDSMLTAHRSFPFPQGRNNDLIYSKIINTNCRCNNIYD